MDSCLGRIKLYALSYAPKGPAAFLKPYAED